MSFFKVFMSVGVPLLLFSESSTNSKSQMSSGEVYVFNLNFSSIIEIESL